MDLVMCLSCGEFVRAFKRDDKLVPRNDECPDCGGRKFKDNATETVITTDE
jgi:predicted  nucleic acid-binding Zn-ribbon protein